MSFYYKHNCSEYKLIMHPETYEAGTLMIVCLSIHHVQVKYAEIIYQNYKENIEHITFYVFLISTIFNRSYIKFERHKFVI